MGNRRSWWGLLLVGTVCAALMSVLRVWGGVQPGDSLIAYFYFVPGVAAVVEGTATVAASATFGGATFYRSGFDHCGSSAPDSTLTHLGPGAADARGRRHQHGGRVLGDGRSRHL